MRKLISEYAMQTKTACVYRTSDGDYDVETFNNGVIDSKRNFMTEDLAEEFADGFVLGEPDDSTETV